MKKFLTFVLVLAMVLSVSSFAMAANGLPDAVGEKITLTSGTYTLTDNVILPESISIEVPAGADVVLNLNGKTISQEKECTASYQMIQNLGSLTITGNGKLSFKDTSAGDPTFGWGSYTIRNAGTLVVENGTIEHLGEQNPGGGQPNVHMYCAIFQYSGSTTINGGKISTPTYRSARLWSGEMIINDGVFEGQLWVQCVNDEADLTINGGTFAPCGNDGSSVFVSNASNQAELNITGGNFTKVGCSDASKLDGDLISGGEFSEKPADELLDNSAIAVGNNADGFTVLQKPEPSTTDDPAFVVIPTSYSFGSTVQGTPFGAKTFTVYNSGECEIEVKLPDFGENCIVKWADDSVANKTLSTLNGSGYSAEFTVQPNANLAAGKHTAKADVIAYHNSDEFGHEEITAEFTITAPATSSSGSGISVKYNGGNSFSTSNPAVPTGVEIDGVPVTFNGTGSNFSVGCISSDAKWVTVRWNSTTVTTNFTPDGLVECTTVSIPKTGDMSFWAAVAAFFGF